MFYVLSLGPLRLQLTNKKIFQCLRREILAFHPLDGADVSSEILRWPLIASKATFALNSALNRLLVLMLDRPSRRRTHLKPLSQKPGPPLSFFKSDNLSGDTASNWAKLQGGLMRKCRDFTGDSYGHFNAVLFS